MHRSLRGIADTASNDNFWSALVASPLKHPIKKFNRLDFCRKSSLPTAVFFRKTRLLRRLMLRTSWMVDSLSPRRRMWSPGTTFHHFMRSAGLTDLSLVSNLDFRMSQARGKLFRWLKLVVAGFLVVALKAEVRVRYFRDDDISRTEAGRRVLL